MSYQIRKGDTLYRIARKHHVSVEQILKNNPNVNPYYLEIGSYLHIPNALSASSLKEQMREVWEQHVFWTRLLIISITEHLEDEHDTTVRILRNASDFAELYQPFYGNGAASVIQNLITEHLVIADKLVHSIIENNESETGLLNTEWYKNADKIAEYLAKINPYYDEEELRKMFYKHLDLTKQEVLNRIQKNYKDEIETFDLIEEAALMMADYFTNGIVQEFKK